MFQYLCVLHLVYYRYSLHSHSIRAFPLTSDRREEETKMSKCVFCNCLCVIILCVHWMLSFHYRWVLFCEWVLSRSLTLPISQCMQPNLTVEYNIKFQWMDNNSTPISPRMRRANDRGGKRKSKIHRFNILFDKQTRARFSELLSTYSIFFSFVSLARSLFTVVRFVVAIV